MTNTIIKCKTLYNFEGMETDKGWNIEIIEGAELLTNEIISALENFSEVIRWDNQESYYWFFSYQIGNTWIDGINIDPVSMQMKIGLYK